MESVEVTSSNTRGDALDRAGQPTSFRQSKSDPSNFHYIGHPPPVGAKATWAAPGVRGTPELFVVPAHIARSRAYAGKETLKTIAAVTSDRGEFFRVVNWCYDVAGVGHLVRATMQEQHFELRLTIAKTDDRVESFAAQVADPKVWRILRSE